MSQACYDAIAKWYDDYLREEPMYEAMVLPSLLEIIGDVQGQTICDLACGQGWLTREIARRGASITGIDLSMQLLDLALAYEEQEPLGITYLQGDAQKADLFAANEFDGCMCIWSLADIPDLTAVFQTMYRLLKPDGWLVFAIAHPCFEGPNTQWITLENSRVARAVNGYFDERFWMSEHGGVRSHVGAYHRMISTYVNTLTRSGFALDEMLEPVATGRRIGVQEVPAMVFMRAHALK